jgi:hypothetical protein
VLFQFKGVQIMKTVLRNLPPWLLLAATIAMLAHGPIAQPVHYHQFADDVAVLGLPNAANVGSNLGFFLLGLWGWFGLRAHASHPALRQGWPGYALMLLGLMGVGLGSGFYHLAPDNARLVWDRLPIALVCAGLLAAVRAETGPGQTDVRATTRLLAMLAVASVAWWSWTASHGQGDLRPYLLLQAAPLVLIPLWQAASGAPRAERLAFALAMGLYILAKVAELHDQAIMHALGVLSGHTLKHLLASGGMFMIVRRLLARVRQQPLLLQAA